MQVPGFWDPRRRPERPDLGRVVVIRFLTEIDYPPFNFAGPDGNPQGFNVDLARMMCEEIKVACTIQMRRFETLLPPSMRTAATASSPRSRSPPEMRAKVDFTDPYYRTPGRFVARRDSPIDNPLPEKLEGKKVAVVAGTAHEAYLKALFTEAELKPYPSAEAARLALRQGDVDLLFGDAVSLAFWLNGTDFGQLLRLPRRPLPGQPLFRRRRRHRGQEGQRHHPAGVELGAVPGLGAGPVHRSVAALFSGQPVLRQLERGSQPD